MKTLKRVIVFGFFCLLLNSCDKNAKNVESDRSRSPVDSVMELRLLDDEKNLAMTVDNVNDLAKRLAPLQKGNAEISTDRQEFAWAVNDFGRFPVRCSGISPILDGYKIRLLIGNITSAILDGGTVTVYAYPERPAQRAGEPEIQFQNRLHEWYVRPSVRPVEVKMQTALQPGTWTGVDVVFTPANPNDVKRITVGVEFSTINLSTR